MTQLTTDAELKQLLAQAKTIAVVGHSDKPTRTSYQIAAYLRQAGYTVYPVNPTVTTIDGEPSYTSLADLPTTPDIVNVFRRPEHLADVVREATAINAPAVWAQLGVVSEDAVDIAAMQNLPLVMDRCIKVEHYRLLRS